MKQFRKLIKNVSGKYR